MKEHLASASQLIKYKMLYFKLSFTLRSYTILKPVLLSRRQILLMMDAVRNSETSVNLYERHIEKQRWSSDLSPDFRTAGFWPVQNGTDARNMAERLIDRPWLEWENKNKSFFKIVLPSFLYPFTGVIMTATNWRTDKTRYKQCHFLFSHLTPEFPVINNTRDLTNLWVWNTLKIILT